MNINKKNRIKRLITFLIIISAFLFCLLNLHSYRLPDYLFEDNLTEFHQIKDKEKINITIIIDDIGRDFKTALEIWKINKNITLSILPFLKYSKKISKYAYENNLPVMLHFPMEPINYKNKLESFFLLTNMKDKDFYNITNKILNSIPYYEGINNHMGSKFTSDYQSLDKFFKIVRYKNVFFIDSKTSPFSIAARVSLKYGILTGVRDVFIDNKLDVSYILYQLQKLYNLAKRKEYAIAIGHPHKETIEALKIFFNTYSNIKVYPAKKGLKYFENYEKALVLRKGLN